MDTYSLDAIMKKIICDRCCKPVENYFHEYSALENKVLFKVMCHGESEYMKLDNLASLNDLKPGKAFCPTIFEKLPHPSSEN